MESRYGHLVVSSLSPLFLFVNPPTWWHTQQALQVAMNFHETRPPLPVYFSSRPPSLRIWLSLVPNSISLFPPCQCVVISLFFPPKCLDRPPPPGMRPLLLELVSVPFPLLPYAFHQGYVFSTPGWLLVPQLNHSSFQQISFFPRRSSDRPSFSLHYKRETALILSPNVRPDISFVLGLISQRQLRRLWSQ